MLITELGYFALILALVLALLQAILPTVGVIKPSAVAAPCAKSLGGAVLDDDDFVLCARSRFYL